MLIFNVYEGRISGKFFIQILNGCVHRGFVLDRNDLPLAAFSRREAIQKLKLAYPNVVKTKNLSRDHADTWYKLKE